MAAAHIVQDLEFEVDFESEAQAFDLQERLSAFARGPALRILAEAFDQACAEPELLRIDRLELDLGTVDVAELEAQWEERLRQQLQRVLGDLAGAAAPREPAGAAGAARRSSMRHAELEALLHYLREGVLPWQAPLATHPAELARRVWANGPDALTARLREWPDAPTAARRMARQFPADWCRQLARALQADIGLDGPAAPRAPEDVDSVERQLLQALRGAARRAPRPAVAGADPQAPALRTARRRWRALLVDDAPEIANDDLGELIELWQRLRHEDAEGLLRDVQTLGRRARVRRRMARLWPETLLRQLPGLWLGDQAGRLAVATLEAPEVVAEAGDRRERWEALLRLLWADPEVVERIDVQALRDELRGRRREPRPPMQPVWPGSDPGPHDAGPPTLEGEAWPAGSDAAAGRRALRAALSSAQHLRRLAADLTQPGLARMLGLWGPAPEADALAALAFAPLPRAWQRETKPWPQGPTLVLGALQALHEAMESGWRAQGLVERWWRAIAVQLERSPDELLRALHEVGADDGEARRREAWSRWLPQPRSQPASSTAPAAALAKALRHGDRAAWQSAWSALLGDGPQAARDALRQLGNAGEPRQGLARQLDATQWRQLLEVFLAPQQAQEVVRAEQALRSALHEPDDTTAEAALRHGTLAVLLWQPGATAADVASHLLEQGSRRAGLAAATLAHRLPGDVRALCAPWLAERAAPPPHADAESLAQVIAVLRGSGLGPDIDAVDRARLMRLADDEAASAAGAISRELESAQAAQVVARALAPEELLQLVTWLRPAEADALRLAWPRLRALGQGLDEGQGGPAWPRVARLVLRELFEEDRPLRPPALLQRAEALLRGTPDPAPSSAPPSHDEPLFIANAGIVLLAPYLPRLFGLIGLADDNAFADGVAAERAVAVMQYAVTGEAAAPETALPLNKLLCGLPLRTPVMRCVELSRAEREAVDGMLAAVIGHWKALGRTSVAGLRQTFLQREGRLDHKEEAWHLQVPTQAFDMLIDRLPWGFSTIRYPWMPEVLHVQWR